MRNTLFYLLFILLTFPYRIFGDMQSQITRPEGTVDFTGIGPFIANIISYAIGIAGILGVIGITWGGIQMILSTGDDEKIKKGKSTMIYSLIGVILAGIAYSIVGIIGGFRI